MKIKILPVHISFLFTPIYWGYCQYPSYPCILPEMPKPTSMIPGVRVGSAPSTPTPAYPLYRKQQTGDYNPDEISRRNRASQMAENEAIAFMKEQENTVRLPRQVVDSVYPSLSGEEGTESFHSAFEELRKKLSDSVPMDLGKAVFITENAVLYVQFDNRYI